MLSSSFCGLVATGGALLTGSALASTFGSWTGAAAGSSGTTAGGVVGVVVGSVGVTVGVALAFSAAGCVTSAAAASKFKVLSNSSLVKPFKTTLVPSSFSILVTGVPAKLLDSASISVKNWRLVSRFFSSKGRWCEVK